MRALSIDNPYSAEEINILQESHSLKMNQLKSRFWLLCVLRNAVFVGFVLTLCSLFLVLFNESWYDRFAMQSVAIFVFYMLYVFFEIKSERARKRYREHPGLFAVHQSPALLLQQLSPDHHHDIIEFIVKIQHAGRALTHHEHEFVTEQLKKNI